MLMLTEHTGRGLGKDGAAAYDGLLIMEYWEYGARGVLI
jgi:hypothetical protein